jgi:1-deoxy-D-xylulose-5-phosphate reductoisomerase
VTRGVTILGATGSVGVATMDVISANPALFHVDAMTANANAEALAQQAKISRAKLAVIADETKYQDLKNALSGTDIKTAAGKSGLLEAASYPSDCTMAAIVGMAGLEPILRAIENGKNVAIANKEPLVAAGTLVMEAAKKSGASILPVDSEHNAIFQVFDTANRASIRRIILTASGGPFRDWSLAQMEQATPAQALKHPNWTMGQKISIDSATIMNKALEVIEAHHLFAMPPKKIDVVLHPQSIIHSMVEYSDGSVLSQMGASDMRIPIANALGWPKRISSNAPRLDFANISPLTFGVVDDGRFPAIKLAYDCLKEGAGACIAFNAANEMAAAAFLENKIGFLDIFRLIQKTVETIKVPPIHDLQTILAFDASVRQSVQAMILTITPINRKIS